MPSKTILVFGLSILGLTSGCANLNDGNLHVINGSQPYEVAYGGKHYSLVCRERTEIKVFGILKNFRGPCDLSEADGLKVFGHDDESYDDYISETLEEKKWSDALKNCAAYDQKNKQFVVVTFHNRQTPTQLKEIIYTFSIVGTK